MRTICFALLLLFAATPIDAWADGGIFNGVWRIDIRSKSERKNLVDCGQASFILIQDGNRICGDHDLYIPGCGRNNEGDPGSVRGVVTGSSALLEVTSGRNGAIIRGKATRKGDTLHWIILEEVSPGDTEGDSPLILDKGMLELKKSEPISKELLDACNARKVQSP